MKKSIGEAFQEGATQSTKNHKGLESLEGWFWGWLPGELD